MKVLALIAGGLGNQIQMTAAIRTLRERLGISVEIIATGAPTGGDELRQLFAVPAHSMSWWPKRETFEGVVALTYAASKIPDRFRGLRVLNNPARQAVRADWSEVDTSMNACRDMGVGEDDLIWHGELQKPDVDEAFDVVISNGYYRNQSHYWAVKGYPHFKTLVEAIHATWPNLSLCSIGHLAEEHIPGTVDKTRIPLAMSLGLIANAKFVVSTDSMAFHAAPVYDVPTFALFTATSVAKNADLRFHATARIIGREDLRLGCRRMCQEQQHRWNRCTNWKCQNISVEQIIEVIANDESRWRNRRAPEDAPVHV